MAPTAARSGADTFLNHSWRRRNEGDPRTPSTSVRNVQVDDRRQPERRGCLGFNGCRQSMRDARIRSGVISRSSAGFQRLRRAGQRSPGEARGPRGVGDRAPAIPSDP